MILDFESEKIRILCDELYEKAMFIAEIHLNEGDYETAIMLYERYLMYYRPNNPDAILKLFWAKKKLENIAVAEM